MIRADRIHLKERKGPVTDRRRKQFIATTANLLAAVRRPRKATTAQLMREVGRDKQARAGR